jgi:hypothetical protein
MEDQLRKRQQDLENREQQFDLKMKSQDETKKGQEEHKGFTFGNMKGGQQQSPQQSDATRRRRHSASEDRVTGDSEDSLNRRFERGADIGRHNSSPHVHLPPPVRKDQRLPFLPPAQHQMRGHEEKLEEWEDQISTERFNLHMWEKQFQRMGVPVDDEDLAERRRMVEAKENAYRIKKHEVQRSKLLAERFKASLEIPLMLAEPRGFERNYRTLDPHNIMRLIPGFDPKSVPEKDFQDTWNRIVAYGRNQYLQENHYLMILGLTLNGEALRTFNDLQKAGYGLTYVLETLGDLYASKQTLLEDQKAVDDFVRLKNETMRKAMNRCKCMVERLRQLSSEAAWPETKHKLLRGVLKQIISIKTRKYLDLEESKVTEEGGSISIDILTDMADRFERNFDEVPTKDSPTVYQTASGQTKISAMEAAKNVEQLKRLKTEQFQSKGLEKKLDEVLQLASANFKQRGRSLDKKRDYAHAMKRDGSASSTKSALPDTDVQMKDESRSSSSASFRPSRSGVTFSGSGQDQRSSQPRNDRKRSRDDRDRADRRDSSSDNRDRADRRDSSSNNSYSRDSGYRGRSSSGNRSRPRSRDQQDRYRRQPTPGRGYSGDRRRSSSGQRNPDSRWRSDSRRRSDGYRDQNDRRDNRDNRSGGNSHRNGINIIVNDGVQYVPCMKCSDMHRLEEVCRFKPGN